MYHRGCNATGTCSQNGHAGIVKLLLDGGADVNGVRTVDSVTPLRIASKYGHAGIVNLLLDKSPDVDVKRASDGATPLWIAAEGNHAGIVRLLLAHSADSGIEIDRVTLLRMAESKGYNQIADLIRSASNNP